MKSSGQSSHWIGRIIGAVVVAGAAFLLLCFWNTWDLNMPLRIVVAVVVGILFLVFGGSVWKWIEQMDLWS